MSDAIACGFEPGFFPRPKIEKGSLSLFFRKSLESGVFTRRKKASH